MPVRELEHVTAATLLTRWNSFSRPAAFLCQDGRKYVFKGPHLQRVNVTEHVVGRLGEAMGAPCVRVCIGTVPEEVLNADPSLRPDFGGPCHATEMVPDVHDLRTVAHHNFAENRPRFAALLVLYSWMTASDHQLLYGNVPPHLVHSHDHGLFFPSAQNWSAATLAVAPDTVLDPWFAPAALTPEEIGGAATMLASLTDADLQTAVGDVCPEWGVGPAELDALVAYLRRRRDSAARLAIL